MIIYELECALGHRFEGWFPSGKAFEEQLRRGLVQCAVCGEGNVRNIPSGGHVAHAHPSQAVPSKKAETKRAKEEVMANVDPITLMKMVDHYVKTNFKDVGNQFAKKAMEIHNGLAEKEPIYGTATPQERKALVEEEVPFVTIPKLPESTEN